MQKRFISSAVATAGVALAMAAPTMAATTLGQLAPDNTTAECAVHPYDVFSPDPTGGNSYVATETGTITSWSTQAAAGANQAYSLKVFRKIGEPTTYSVAGHDGPRDLSPSSLNTFAVSIPVKPGDVIGVNAGTATSGKTACTFLSPSPASAFELAGDLADGASSSTFAKQFSPQLANVTAVLDPSNAFTIGTPVVSKTGAISLPLSLSNPGTVSVSGTGVAPVTVKAAAAGPATAALQANVKPKKKQKKAKTKTLSLSVSFTPDNGTASTQTTAVKVKVKPKKKKKGKKKH